MRLPALTGPEAGFSAAAARRAEGCGSSPAIPRTLPANAPPTVTFFRNSRLASFPFFFFVATIASSTPIQVAFFARAFERGCYRPMGKEMQQVNADGF